MTLWIQSVYKKTLFLLILTMAVSLNLHINNISKIPEIGKLGTIFVGNTCLTYRSPVKPFGFDTGYLRVHQMRAPIY